MVSAATMNGRYLATVKARLAAGVRECTVHDVAVCNGAELVCVACKAETACPMGKMHGHI